MGTAMSNDGWPDCFGYAMRLFVWFLISGLLGIEKVARAVRCAVRAFSPCLDNIFFPLVPFFCTSPPFSPHGEPVCCG